MRKKLSGVKLAHHKNTANTASQPLPLPKRVRIPMSMHIGAPCSPLVKVRDSICVGQKIGDTDAFMAAPIHSGVSGTVKAVSDFRMSNGRTCKCVEIETDGLQTVADTVQPPVISSKEDFLHAIRESGLVGMGGASFPTHVKLAPKQTVDTLCINAAECEPYITSDNRQMVEHPEEVIDGIQQVLHWLNIPHCIIGVESNKPEAIQILTEKAASDNRIQVVTLPSTYPQGAEKVLIYHTLGRIVAEGELPADQGVIECFLCCLCQPLPENWYADGTANGNRRWRLHRQPLQRHCADGNACGRCPDFCEVRFGTGKEAALWRANDGHGNCRPARPDFKGK